MKIPKYFEKWYREYGRMGDRVNYKYYDDSMRIAWRAYRKGKKDAAENVKQYYNKKSKSKWEKEAPDCGI